MTPEHKQQAKQLIADWTNVSRTSTPAVWFLNADCMAGFLRDLIDAPEPEPFGYFKSEPFGWTDCAETDDGAIALYTAPPAPSVPELEEYDAGALNDFGGGNVGWWQDYIRSELGRAYEFYCGQLSAAPTPAEAPADVARDAWYGSNPPSLVQATAIYMALLEAAQNPQKLSDERILELFYEHSKPDRWPFGFARAIEREILGGES